MGAIVDRYGNAIVSDVPASRDYRPGPSRVWFQQLRDLPIFSLETVRWMLQDPTIRLGLSMRRAPLCAAQFAYKEGEQWVPGIQADKPEVAAFIERQLQAIWSLDITKILSSQVWGWSGGEVLYKADKDTGLMEFSEIRSRLAIDVNAVTLRGNVVGIEVARTGRGKVRLEVPGKAYWHPYNPEGDEPYGESILYGAYSAFADKWFEGGALDTRRLFMHADAYAGRRIGYPPGSTMVDGESVPNRDIARNMIEMAQSGDVMAYPMVYDEKGHPLWVVEDAKSTVNGQHMLEFPKDLDIEMLRGLEIPDEIITGGASGAWQGKQVPMQAFYMSLNQWMSQVVSCVTRHIIEPLVMWNWNKAHDFEVTFKPLDIQAMEEQQGQQQQQQPEGGPPEAAGGFGGMMQPPGGPPPGGGPGGPGGAPGGAPPLGLPGIGMSLTEKVGRGEISASKVISTRVKEKREFSCLMAMLPTGIANKVTAFANRLVDGADLHEKGFETEPHVTVVYGIRSSEPFDVEKCLRDESPVHVRIGKVGVFECDEYDVLKVYVESPDLHRLHNRVLDCVSVKRTHPHYEPHVTLAYLKPGAGVKYNGTGDAPFKYCIEGMETSFNELVFSNPHEEKDTIPLCGARRLSVDAETQRMSGNPADWVEYHGGDGGTGWQNKNTGEVRYQEKQPFADARVEKKESAPVDESEREDETDEAARDNIDLSHYPIGMKNLISGLNGDQVDADYLLDVLKKRLKHFGLNYSIRMMIDDHPAGWAGFLVMDMLDQNFGWKVSEAQDDLYASGAQQGDKDSAYEDVYKNYLLMHGSANALFISDLVEEIKTNIGWIAGPDPKVKAGPVKKSKADELGASSKITLSVVNGMMGADLGETNFVNLIEQGTKDVSSLGYNSLSHWLMYQPIEKVGKTPEEIASQIEAHLEEAKAHAGWLEGWYDKEGYELDEHVEKGLKTGIWEAAYKLSPFIPTEQSKELTKLGYSSYEDYIKGWGLSTESPGEVAWAMNALSWGYPPKDLDPKQKKGVLELKKKYAATNVGDHLKVSSPSWGASKVDAATQDLCEQKAKGLGFEDFSAYIASKGGNPQSPADLAWFSYYLGKGKDPDPYGPVLKAWKSHWTRVRTGKHKTINPPPGDIPHVEGEYLVDTPEADTPEEATPEVTPEAKLVEMVETTEVKPVVDKAAEEAQSILKNANKKPAYTGPESFDQLDEHFTMPSSKDEWHQFGHKYRLFVRDSLTGLWALKKSEQPKLKNIAAIVKAAKDSGQSITEFTDKLNKVAKSVSSGISYKNFWKSSSDELKEGVDGPDVDKYITALKEIEGLKGKSKPPVFTPTTINNYFAKNQPNPVGTPDMEEQLDVQLAYEESEAGKIDWTKVPGIKSPYLRMCLMFGAKKSGFGVSDVQAAIDLPKDQRSQAFNYLLSSAYGQPGSVWQAKQLQEKFGEFTPKETATETTETAATETTSEPKKDYKPVPSWNDYAGFIKMSGEYAKDAPESPPSSPSDWIKFGYKYALPMKSWMSNTHDFKPANLADFYGIVAASKKHGLGVDQVIDKIDEVYNDDVKNDVFDTFMGSWNDATAEKSYYSSHVSSFAANGTNKNFAVEDLANEGKISLNQKLYDTKDEVIADIKQKVEPLDWGPFGSLTNLEKLSAVNAIEAAGYSPEEVFKQIDTIDYGPIKSLAMDYILADVHGQAGIMAVAKNYASKFDEITDSEIANAPTAAAKGGEFKKGKTAADSTSLFDIGTPIDEVVTPEGWSDYMSHPHTVQQAKELVDAYNQASKDLGTTHGFIDNTVMSSFVYASQLTALQLGIPLKEVAEKIAHKYGTKTDNEVNDKYQSNIAQIKLLSSNLGGVGIYKLIDFSDVGKTVDEGSSGKASTTDSPTVNIAYKAAGIDQLGADIAASDVGYASFESYLNSVGLDPTIPLHVTYGYDLANQGHLGLYDAAEMKKWMESKEENAAGMDQTAPSTHGAVEEAANLAAEAVEGDEYVYVTDEKDYVDEAHKIFGVAKYDDFGGHGSTIGVSGYSGGAHETGTVKATATPQEKRQAKIDTALSNTHSDFIQAVKGIAYKEHPKIRQTDIDRVIALRKTYDDTLNILEKDGDKNAATKFKDSYGPWIGAMEEIIKVGEDGEKGELKDGGWTAWTSIKPDGNISTIMVKAKPDPKVPGKTGAANDEKVFKFVKALGGFSGMNASLVVDGKGNKFVRKEATGDKIEHMQEEMLADLLYAKIGTGRKFIMEEKNGKLYKYSPFIENAQPLMNVKGEAREAAYKELQKGFAMDVLMANWDVLGQGLDNVLVGDDGSVHRIDNGGSLRFTAQGHKKGAGGKDPYSKEVKEIYSMRAPNNGAGRAYASMSDVDAAINIHKFLVDHSATIAKALKSEKSLLETVFARMSYMKNWAESIVPYDKIKAYGQGGFQEKNVHLGPSDGSSSISKETMKSLDLSMYSKDMQKKLKKLKDKHDFIETMMSQGKSFAPQHKSWMTNHTNDTVQMLQDQGYTETQALQVIASVKSGGNSTAPALSVKTWDTFYETPEQRAKTLGLKFDASDRPAIKTMSDHERTEWRKNLAQYWTKEMVEGVNKYAGSYYSAINSPAWKDAHSWKDASKLKAKMDSQSYKLLKGIQQSCIVSNGLPKPITIWRKLPHAAKYKGGFIDQAIAAAGTSQTIVHKSPASCSVSSSFSAGWSGSDYIMEIAAKNGTPGNSGESEIVQAAGTTYRVLAIHKNVKFKTSGGYTKVLNVIQCEEIEAPLPIYD